LVGHRAAFAIALATALTLATPSAAAAGQENRLFMKGSAATVSSFCQ
jgi:hypothetical protein